jgi:hypothetical protein
MLADLRDLTRREQLRGDRSRVRLLATLRALHGHGAAWPAPAVESLAAPGTRRAELTAALGRLGLQPTTTDAEAGTGIHELRAGGRRVTVTIRPDEDVTLDVVERDTPAWTAKLHLNTPTPVVTATVAAAITDTPAQAALRPLDWGPGFVRLPGLPGPYPALIADPLTVHGYLADDHVWARVTADTITHICADRAALTQQPDATTLPELRLIDDHVEVIHPTGSGTPTQVIHPDAEGFFLLAGWPWTPTNPPQPLP